MVEKDVLELLTLIEAEFPRHLKGQTEEQKALKLALWKKIFENDDKKHVDMAIHKILSTSEFPPTIAEIRKAMVEVKEGESNTAGEAWGEVQRAIRNYGYMQEAKALNSMSPETARAVKCIGWATLCLSEEQMADRAHFLKIYAELKERTEREKALPNRLSEAIKRNALAYKSDEVKTLEVKKIDDTESYIPLESIQIMLDRAKKAIMANSRNEG